MITVKISEMTNMYSSETQSIMYQQTKTNAQTAITTTITRTIKFTIIESRLKSTQQHSIKKLQLRKQKLPHLEFEDITMDVSINGQPTKAISDTGSPVTVISKILFDRMDKKFDDGNLYVQTSLGKTSISLYLCEAESAVSTIGECNVLIIYKGSMCVSSVNVAKNLAHDCLLGMNVLTKWPGTKDAIEVLLKASGNKTYEGHTRFNTNAKATRHSLIRKMMREDRYQDKY